MTRSLVAPSEAWNTRRHVEGLKLLSAIEPIPANAPWMMERNAREQID